MDIAIWILTLISTFLISEFTAWFNHKYIMHGPLWILHKDHHKKDHKSWFERNDLFDGEFEDENIGYESW